MSETDKPIESVESVALAAVSSPVEPAPGTAPGTAPDNAARPDAKATELAPIHLGLGAKSNSTVNVSDNDLGSDDGATGTATGTVGVGSGAIGGTVPEGHGKLDKTVLSNINKSLKAKQKITKELKDRADTNRSPVATPFLSQSSSANISVTTPDISEGAPNLSLDADKAKKLKILSKQNSTRTDFFAAKLASAVDDVDSSDSDETFVYDTNVNVNFRDSDDPPPPLTLDDTNQNLQTVKPQKDPKTLKEPKEVKEPKEPKKTEAQLESDRDLELGPDEPLAGPEKPRAPASLKPMVHASLNSSFSSSQFLDGLINKTLRPSNQRTLSTNSLETPKHPASPFHNSHTSSQFHSYKIVNTSDEYISDNYTDDNLDKLELGTDADADAEMGADADTDTGVVDVDDVSSQELYAAEAVPKKSPAKPPAPATSKKSATTSSSKLRSTTSKLFDKRGSQPRRYSIIPHDIDIEDFDDELIYYDNTVRFPHHGTTYGTDTVPLLTTPRIPHYRSLNLNLQKRPPKTKRYVSGSQIGATPSRLGPHHNHNNHNTDIFPFPYPHRHNQDYYGFDEYDEESASLTDKLSPKPSRFGFNGDALPRFVLPRQKSFILGSNMAYDYSYVKRTVYTLISVFGILSIGFIMGFVIATTKELSDATIVGIESAVVSSDELVFNVVVEALNPGWFTIVVEDVEIDIFAKSGYLGTDNTDRTDKTDKTDNTDKTVETVETVETVLLGSVYNLESPVAFPGGFFNRDVVRQIGELKLISPGKNLTSADNSTNPDNNDKWQVICKHPFDLIIRGSLKYNLPISKNVRSIVVTKTSYIDPTALV